MSAKNTFSLRVVTALLAFLAVSSSTQFSVSQAQTSTTTSRSRLLFISGPITDAMGGAGVTSRQQSEAGFVNPAGLAAARGPSFAAVYSTGSVLQDTKYNSTSVVAVDPSTVPEVPTSLSYVSREIKRSGEKAVDHQYISASFGQYVKGPLSVGLSVIHSTVRFEDTSYQEWNGILGALYSPTKSLTLGMAFRNFVHPEEVPSALRLVPEFVFGLDYNVRGLLVLRGEVAKPEHLNPDEKWILRTGLEAPVWNFFVYRMGYRYDQTLDEGVMTVGLGFDGPRFRIDYYFQEIQVRDGKTLQGIDLRIPF